MKFSWNDFMYDLADFFFAKQMDEAYDQGIRIGAEYSARMISFRVNSKESTKNLTKTQAQGYAVANEIVQSCKPDISRQTGAML